jgi:hypothetical protein
METALAVRQPNTPTAHPAPRPRASPSQADAAAAVRHAEQVRRRRRSERYGRSCVYGNNDAESRSVRKPGE